MPTYAFAHNVKYRAFAVTFEKRCETMSYYKNVRVRQMNAPFESSSFEQGLWPAAPQSSGSDMLSSLKNMNWKQLVDQLGGIDGIVTRMNQVQKLVSTVQQFAPMLKMLSGSFGGRTPLATTEDSEDERMEARVPKRRKKRKNGASASRRKRRYL
jgi:hypothetical protein